MLQIVTYHGAYIMIGHSKKWCNQVSAAFKEIKPWTFDTTKQTRERVSTKILGKTTNEMY